jgi:hypothetical protein
MDAVATHALSAAEAGRLETDGFILRRGVFGAAEVARLAEDCEALAARVQASARGEKEVGGSYMFQRQWDTLVAVKWEPQTPDLLQGVEPLAHISPELRAWGEDARLLDTAAAMIGEPAALWTEKLNLKRARDGGQYTLHQDYPYWRKINAAAERIVTAMVFMDEATVENGCLLAAPGSHRQGMHPRRQVDGIGGLEMDPEQFDLDRLVPIEAGAGDVLFFGSFLVHKSLPNRSERDRRALLYSYQPAGMPHNSEVRARLWPEQRLTLS